jgi:transcription antitermination factor NusG
MAEDQEVKGIIEQLRRLQLQQTQLLSRLAFIHGTRAESRANATEPTPPNVVREFAVGDRVRIKNPGPFQAHRGTIAKIGAHRITVRTRSGSRIQRAPHNIELTE